jgi:hypothetical protein
MADHRVLSPAENTQSDTFVAGSIVCNQCCRDLKAAFVGHSLSFQPQLSGMPALSRDEPEKLIANTRLLARVAEHLKRHQVGG